MIKIIAFQIAENINLKKFKADYKDEFLNSSSFELFYKYKQGYIYLLSYGVVAFANIEETYRTAFLKDLKKYGQHNLDLTDLHQEDFIIDKTDNSQPVFSYNAMFVPEVNQDIIKITMLQVAQSTALDFYLERSQNLYNETVKLTTQLEHYGTIKESKDKLLRFIGKGLNIKHRIIDNLYVFDTPAIVWENELLGKVNDGLSNLFDIKIRFKEVEYILKNVESNLSIFIEIANASKSHRLEWIIIFLILFEVMYTMVKEFT